MLLHAFKFPHQAVCGVLVGQIVDGSQIVVSHAVALAHGHINLTPMLQIALSQVEGNAGFQEEGLTIVGYYQANAHLQDNGQVGEAARKIGDSIRARTDSETACMLLVDNEAIANLGTSDKCALQGMLWNAKKKQWVLHGEEVIEVPTGSGDAVVATFHADGHQKLVDFDQHLEDVSQDWFNVELLTEHQGR